MSSQTYSIDSSDQQANDRGMRRVAAGIAVSVVAHCILLFAFHYRAPAPLKAPSAAREMLVVHLVAPPPPATPAPEIPKPQPDPVPATNPLKTASPPAKTRVARRTPELIAIPAQTQDKPAAQPTFTVAPAEENPTPAFDPAAARKFARDIANKPDPARAGMAVAQIPEKPLETETKAARAIASAKRGDCRNAPGGLLAPVLMLLDKKDSGCKW